MVVEDFFGAEILARGHFYSLSLRPAAAAAGVFEMRGEKNVRMTSPSRPGQTARSGWRDF